MNIADPYHRRDMGLVALCILLCIICWVLASCQQTPVNNTSETSPDAVNLDGEGNTVEDNDEINNNNQVKNVHNNALPWMIATIAMPVIFFAYLFFDKRFPRFGRGSNG